MPRAPQIPPGRRPNLRLVEDMGPIDNGPDDPQPPDMEARVAKLEADMSEVKGDLKSLLKDVSEIKGRVASMPTAWQLLGMNLTIVLAVMGATFAIIRFGLS